MVGIAIDQSAQLIGIPKGRQRPVNQTDDFAQADLRRRPAQPISALGAAHAFHDARVFQFQQNQFQKFFRQIFFVGNVANPDRTLGIAPGQHHHRLQRIQPFLGNLHRRLLRLSLLSLIGIIENASATAKALNCRVLGWACDFSKLPMEGELRRGRSCARFCTFGSGSWDFPRRTPLSGANRLNRKRRISTVMLSGPPRSRASSISSRPACSALLLSTTSRISASCTCPHNPSLQISEHVFGAQRFGVSGRIHDEIGVGA